MPANRASMPGKVANRSTALSTYITTLNIVAPSSHMGGLNARFSSFANTIQTRLNSSNGTTGGLGGTLEAQVNSALSQVLRQNGNGATTAVATRPADTSITSMVGGGGGLQPAMSPYQAALLRESRITQADFLSILDSLQPLSPFTDPGDVAALQAVVRAEVTALLEEFSYARLLPRQQRVRVFLGGLLGWSYDFFGAASPFAPGAPAGDIQALVYLLNLGGPLIPTLSVEDQLASQQVLGTDGALLDAQWRAFWSSALQNTRPLLPGTTQAQPQPFWPLWEWKPDGTTPPIVPGGLGNLLVADSIGSALPHGQQLVLFGPGGPLQAQQAPWRIGVVNDGGTPITATGSVINASYAERMIQTDLLMPVIAQDASRAGDDLTAIGFTAAEQETTFAWFWSAVDSDLLTTATAPVPAPPGWTVLGSNTLPIPVYMTVADILDWAQTLAGPASADQLRNAGALGLNLICDQADELFWLVLAMLDPTASAQIPALADTEVQLELVSLATDLNTLANLAY